MKILFLDDDKRRTVKFKSLVPCAMTAETSEQMIELLSEDAHFDFVFLDHDLGGEIYVDSSRDDTGMEVVRWIVKNKPSIGQVVVHSLNYPCAMEMVRDLKDAGYVFTFYMPFIRFDEEVLDSILV